jgi:hypothetical protein
MKSVSRLCAIAFLTVVPFHLLAQDNGNDFNLVWADPDGIVGASYGYYANTSEVPTASTHQRLQVVDYDDNGLKEIVGWDHIDETYFAIEAIGDDTFELKRFFSFFPYYIDLNDDGIDEAIHLDKQSDPDSVVVQLVTYEASLDSFVIQRDLGRFPKPPSENLMEFYFEKDNFDDDANSEIVILSYDRWANPYGGITVYLVVFELTSKDVATAGIKIEHLETIEDRRFQALATVAPADFDNDGQREMVLVSMERKRILIYESRGEDQYERVYDTTRYAREALHTFKSLSYIGDLDGDGLDDIWYGGQHGALYVIPGRGSYDSTFTYDNSALLMKVDGSGEWLGGLLGDCDADGKPNMYWWDLALEALFDMEYQGGDLRDPNNYTFTKIYQGDLSDAVWTRFAGMNIGGYRSGILDIDNDGKRDFVVASPNDFEIGDGDWPRLYVFESVHSYTTDVNEDGLVAQRPADYVLLSGYPNPARRRATLEYELRAPSPVTLNVYNVRGQVVRTLEKGLRAAGRYRVEVDIRDLSSGLYFARLGTKFGQNTFKILITR